MKLTGRLKTGNRIVIPEDVNPESIVVHLTPYGSWQELYVSSVDYGKYINVKSNAGNNVDCFYIVEAEELSQS
tara:strand:- start:331 stop:549 length:219 start_codon:yes stop_codon:yes gene_type:complete